MSRRCYIFVNVKKSLLPKRKADNMLTADGFYLDVSSNDSHPGKSKFVYLSIGILVIVLLGVVVTVALLKTKFDQDSSTTIVEGKILREFHSHRYETSKNVQKRAIRPLRRRTEENLIDDVWKQSSCSLQIGRLILVQMGGESSTRLQDDTRIHYRQYQTVEVYDNMYYQLQVQLSCQGLIGLNSGRNRCAQAQDVYAWIDFNDNNYPDPSEIHRLYRAQSKRKSGVNMYDLEVYIPIIDEVKTRSGAHKMALSIKPSEVYRRTCDNDGYEEIHEYTVIIRSSKSQYYLL